MGRAALIHVPIWLVITALGIGQIIGWGSTYYAIGALSPDIAAATGWSKTLIFGAFSASLVVSGAISAPVGRLFDRKGGRRLMPLGSLLCAVGCAVIGLVPTIAGYIAGWLILGVAMRFALYDAVLTSIAQLTGGNARRAISYMTLLGGLASTVFWPLNHYLALHVGWSNTFLVNAALHLFVCLPIHLVFLRAAEPLARDDPATSDTLQPILRGAERRTAMSLFAAAVALNGLVFSSISAHVLPLFQSLGFKGDEAVAFAALIGPSQVASRIGELLLGKHLKPVHLGALAFGLLPLALLIFIAGQFSFAAAVVFATLYGASNGIITIAKGVVPLALFGRRGYGEVLGIIAAPNLALNAAAPLLFSWLLDIASAPVALMAMTAAAILSTLAMSYLALLHPR